MRASLRAAATFAALLAVSPPAAADELRQTQERIAELHEAKDQYHEALSVWRQLLAAHPEQQRYLERVAEIATDLGLHQIALPAARKLVSLSPEEPRYQARLAAVLIATKKHREAREQLAQLLRRNPGSVELRRELAHAHEACKDFAAALREYDWLLKRDPANVEDSLARADVLGELDRDHQQRAALVALSRRHPKNVDVVRALAEHYVDQEAFGEARRALGALLALRPADPWATDRLAKLGEAAAAARRRRVERLRRDQRYSDWIHDNQHRLEDF